MPAQREVDEATISQQVEKIAEGIRTKDLEGLKQLYATNVVSFDVEPPLSPFHPDGDGFVTVW
jgi:ketosteroid isomerase-like protein